MNIPRLCSKLYEHPRSSRKSAVLPTTSWYLFVVKRAERSRGVLGQEDVKYRYVSSYFECNPVVRALPSMCLKAVTTCISEGEMGASFIAVALLGMGGS
jgi:hypothetical protein